MKNIYLLSILVFSSIVSCSQQMQEVQFLLWNGETNEPINDYSLQLFCGTDTTNVLVENSCIQLPVLNKELGWLVVTHKDWQIETIFVDRFDRMLVYLNPKNKGGCSLGFIDVMYEISQTYQTARTIPCGGVHIYYTISDIDLGDLWLEAKDYMSK